MYTFKFFIFYLSGFLIFNKVELRYEKDFECALCRIILNELNYEVVKVDPKLTIDRGSFRLKANGDMITEKVSYARSDTFLTSIIEKPCKNMKFYGQKWFKNYPYFVKTVSDNGEKYDLGGVLNQENVTAWLKNTCDGFVDDNEDQLKAGFAMFGEDHDYLTKVKRYACIEELGLCQHEHFEFKDELDFLDIENLDVKNSADEETKEAEAVQDQILNSNDTSSETEENEDFDDSISTWSDLESDRAQKYFDIPHQEAAEISGSFTKFHVNDIGDAPSGMIDEPVAEVAEEDVDYGVDNPDKFTNYRNRNDSEVKEISVESQQQQQQTAPSNINDDDNSLL